MSILKPASPDIHIFDSFLNQRLFIKIIKADSSNSLRPDQYPAFKINL
jgi:hypothetical protein